MLVTDKMQPVGAREGQGGGGGVGGVSGHGSR